MGVDSIAYIEGGEVSALPKEILVTIAEVAAAFVGFSMVVGLLRREDSDSETRFYTIRDVAEIGLVALAGAFAPLSASLFEISEPSAFRLCSLGLAVLWSIGIASSLVRYRAMGQSPFYVGLAPGVGITGFAALGQVLLWWNVAFTTQATAARYVLALLLLLGCSALMFIAATFGPRRPSQS